ncbi:MAG TPA: alkaline phosphatase family protein [Gemmataceae bacterium]|nr:alkaline phosphatase family protein [Gemmataceae bacterium]
MRRILPCLLLAGLATLSAGTARAGTLGTVFYIDMENHNLTQPSPGNGTSGNPDQLKGNPAAPYLNSLITPGNPNAAQVSYAPNYYNVAPGIHPSEPNYIWQEGGSNFGVANDNDPSKANGNIFNKPSLSGLLQAKYGTAGWKAYAEDMQYSTLTNGVPMTSASGTNGTVNQFNGSTQYNFAPKHVGQLFYSSTTGLNNPGEGQFYAQLSQLQSDLNTNNLAKYNLITPDQYNDMHSALNGGFTYHGTTYTGDQASVAQGDNFLAQIVSEIMASQAYKNNGAIVIWYDETEGGDSNQYTLPEIVISPLAKGNAYASPLTYTHSSDLKSLEELFGLPLLGDSATPGTNDLGDLFRFDVFTVPEPSTLGLFALAGAALAGWRWRRGKRAA